MPRAVGADREELIRLLGWSTAVAVLAALILSFFIKDHVAVREGNMRCDDVVLADDRGVPLLSDKGNVLVTGDQFCHPVP